MSVVKGRFKDICIFLINTHIPLPFKRKETLQSRELYRVRFYNFTN